MTHLALLPQIKIHHYKCRHFLTVKLSLHVFSNATFVPFSQNFSNSTNKLFYKDRNSNEVEVYPFRHLPFSGSLLIGSLKSS